MQYINVFNKKYIEIAKRERIFPKFKVQVLDNFENVMYEITNDISKDDSGSVSINYQQGVRRSMSITIIDTDGTFINRLINESSWAIKKIKLLIGLYDNISGDIYWFSQGVFYINGINAEHVLSSKKITIQGVDKFGFLGSETGYNQLEGTYLIPEGTKIYSAIKDILLLETGNGFVIDPIEPILDPAFVDEVTPYDVKKSPGGYMSEILIEFAYILGASIFYDTEGRLNIVKGTLDNLYSNYPTVWEFSESTSDYSQPNFSLDIVNFVNIVKVVGTNVNDKIYEYTAINDNPSSPTRVSLVGKKIKYIETPMAYSEDRAKDYAEYKLNELSMLQSSVSFQSSMLPHLDVDNVVNVFDKYYNPEFPQRFIIQSISMPISTSEMESISACNVATLPYWEGA